jgi:hypothetical protein
VGNGANFFFDFQVIGDIEGTGIILHHADDIADTNQDDGFQAV